MVLLSSALRTGRPATTTTRSHTTLINSSHTFLAGRSKGALADLGSPTPSGSLRSWRISGSMEGGEVILDAIAGAVEIEDYSGAMPKTEIQAAEFLEKHPTYDGRGVVIAILDTGVDPGAAGLQTTSDGKPKIVDVVDCTGSGDIDTSKVVEIDADGTMILGLLGRRLRINPAWVNPTGKWRVGARPAFQLFPGGLKHRSKEERKRRFDEKQRAAVTSATAAVAEFEAANGRAPAAPALSKQLEELQARVKLLEEMAGKYEDLGPMVEAVVWHDGTRWLAALDTSDFYAMHPETAGGAAPSQRGLLEDFTPLTNFRECRQYGTFTEDDACNFAVNIYDEGSTLSIVVDAGSHGTHVAGISAGYHPEDPALNGIAPGAQIVSCKIGDTRLGSMETNVGLTRALIAVLENGCNLINMSYGEATATPNMGRFVRLAEEVVRKHDVIFVASAGNAGPALSTVGAPGGTSSSILGIGAYVTPALAAAGHSVRGSLETGAQYTWSSRGPTPDGDIGVNISAPGGAIAPVPQWSGQLKQLMNGTSMSSPCACGGLALLVSALLAEGQPVTPARIRRAVENTALDLNPADPTSTLTHGRGLLQVASAFEYLQQGAGTHLDDTLRDLRLDVSAKRSDGTVSSRGIYLRDPADGLGPTTWAVEIKPGLKEDADLATQRLGVELKLRVETTAPWVKCPSLLLLHHNGRSFEVEVDPRGLPEGLHYAEVRAYDSTAEWRGPLVRVPITLVKPLLLASQPGRLLATSGAAAAEEQEATIDLGQEAFYPGHEMRKFVSVPHGASWAELKLKTLASETPKAYMVRATAIRPHTRYSDSEYRSFVQLSPRGESVATFKVAQGTTLELTVAQYWSSLGDATLDVEISFHGVEADVFGDGAVLDGAGGPVKVLARAPLRRERFKPSAKLEAVRIPLRPTDAELAPLKGPRDVLPGGRTIHSLLLTYKLSLTEGGKVTPRVPLLNRYVYDGEIEAQMYWVRDDNRQLLSVGDIYPEAATLKKGDYTIHLLLRHEDPALLDRFRALPMLAERKLEASVAVPIYSSNADAVRGKDAISKERQLCPGESASLFLGPVPEEKLPKDATAGRQLVGSLSLGVTAANGKDAPGAMSLVYLVPPKKVDAPAASADAADGDAPPPAPEEALKEAVREAEVKFLGGMKSGSEEEAAAYEKLRGDLLAKYPGHLPLLREGVKRLSGKAKEESAPAEVQFKLVAAADAVLGAIDDTALAVFLGRKCAEEGAGAAKRKKEMEENKAAVVEALAAKCAALLKVEDAAGKEEKKQGDVDVFEAAYEQLRRWVDPAADAAHALLAAKREARAGRAALALKALEKAVNPEDKPAGKDVLQMRAELLETLGWGHWVATEQSRINHAFPLF